MLTGRGSPWPMYRPDRPRVAGPRTRTPHAASLDEMGAPFAAAYILEGAAKELHGKCCWDSRRPATTLARSRTRGEGGHALKRSERDGNNLDQSKVAQRGSRDGGESAHQRTPTSSSSCAISPNLSLAVHERVAERLTHGQGTFLFATVASSCPSWYRRTDAGVAVINAADPFAGTASPKAPV